LGLRSIARTGEGGRAIVGGDQLGEFSCSGKKKDWWGMRWGVGMNVNVSQCFCFIGMGEKGVFRSEGSEMWEGKGDPPLQGNLWGRKVQQELGKKKKGRRFLATGGGGGGKEMGVTKLVNKGGRKMGGSGKDSSFVEKKKERQKNICVYR